MKISKLYSNQSEIFQSIVFNSDINFILSSDHSVGKSTLFALIDFCLLKDKKGVFGKDQFKDVIFYLELKLQDDRYITIVRPTQGSNNIKIKETKREEFLMDCDDYDHIGGVDKSIEYLNSIFNFDTGNYRYYLSYFLRDQDNQSDVFRLNKFMRSKDIIYKPVVSNLLKINGAHINEKYELENNIENLKKEKAFIESELSGYNTSEQVKSELFIYEKQMIEKEFLYQNFDFYLSEKNISKELIDNIEKEISILNQERNSIIREIKYIDEFASQNITVSEDEISGLFEEMRILFPNDLKENYQSVIDFNKQIADERISIFKDNKEKFKIKLDEIEKILQELNEKRKSILSVLDSADSMNKFKKLQKEIIDLSTKINLHKEKLDKFSMLDNKKLEIEETEKKLKDVIIRNKTLINSSFINELKNKINKYSNIVFNKNTAFSAGFNNSDNIDFDLKVEGDDGFDNELENGNTIKKLLCFVFSAAILEMYKYNNFFHFLAFDSPFDGDKNEWQKGVYEAIMELSNQGLQVIVTSIDDVISPVLNMEEIMKKTVRFLSENDKLLGDF
ncbi:hypothetical protein [Campylobacter fetus]|uniref:hypothetical protein n=1 Tax=Campylobacter fetus TaxID=196 RepID=UPI00138DE370|nr:hypothetical protein [Campylobacter fetus]